MRLKTAVLLLLLLGANAAFDANAETLGRLFFTPAERTTLDRARQGLVEKPAEITKPVVGSSRINGLVARSDGQITIWVDSEPRFGQNAQLRVDPSTVQTSKGIVIRQSSQRINQKNEHSPNKK